jgi:hypothetical protein
VRGVPADDAAILHNDHLIKLSAITSSMSSETKQNRFAELSFATAEFPV